MTRNRTIVITVAAALLLAGTAGTLVIRAGASGSPDAYPSKSLLASYPPYTPDGGYPTRPYPDPSTTDPTVSNDPTVSDEPTGPPARPVTRRPRPACRTRPCSTSSPTRRGT